MNSVEKSSNGRFLFNDVISETADGSFTPSSALAPSPPDSLISDEVKEARDRMLNDYRNAWKGNTDG